jgi:hypothetical protein
MLAVQCEQVRGRGKGCGGGLERGRRGNGDGGRSGDLAQAQRRVVAVSER